MNLFEKISGDLIEAQKAKNELQVMTLRAIRSEIKNREIGDQKEVDDEMVTKVLNAEAKKHRDSIEQYKKANRPELVKAEKQELEIIEQYLPEKMSDEDLNQLIDQTIAQVGAKTAADYGKVMGILMPKVAGQVDGSIVSVLVRKKLS